MVPHRRSRKDDDPLNPTVAVVGPGAIGTTVAAALHEVGRTPMLCGRTARERLEFQDAEGIVVVPGPVRIDPAHPAETVDLVFLAVKSTQVDAAAPWLAALCHPGTIVCVLQNGVEQESTVAPHVPDCPVLPAVVWFPAQVQPDGSVWLRGDARLTVPDVTAARVLLEALRGTRCSVDLAGGPGNLHPRRPGSQPAVGMGYPQRCHLATWSGPWHSDADQQGGGSAVGVRQRWTRLISRQPAGGQANDTRRLLPVGHLITRSPPWPA